MKQRRIPGRILLWIIIILSAANALIVLTDNTYLYKAFYYNFADIDDARLFANRRIPNGTPEEWPLGNNYNKILVPANLIKTLENYQSVAFLVIKNDSVRYEKYWEGYGPDSASSSFSMAKSFVGVLTGIAIAEGKIKNVDQPAGDFLPEFREGEKSKITIRHLLTMSSGLEWNESYANPFSVTTRIYYGHDLRKTVATLPVVSPPGKVFKYSSGDTQVLSLVVAAATGEHLAEYASEKLWKKIGAVHPASWSLDKNDGDEKAYCCFNSNARDFARIGKLFMNKGKWGNEQVVPEDYVKASLTPAGLVNNEGFPVNYYGYSWWLLPAFKGHDIFYARGILGQYIFVIPDESMIVVRLGHKRNSKKRNFHPAEVFDYLDGTMDMFTGK